MADPMLDKKSYEPNAPFYQALRNPDLPSAATSNIEEILKIPPCPGEVPEATSATPLALVAAQRKRCSALPKI